MWNVTGILSLIVFFNVACPAEAKDLMRKPAVEPACVNCAMDAHGNIIATQNADGKLVFRKDKKPETETCVNCIVSAENGDVLNRFDPNASRLQTTLQQVQSSLQNVKIVTGTHGLALNITTPPSTVSGTLVITSEMYPDGNPLVCANVSPGLAVCGSNGEKLEISSILPEKTGAKIVGTLTLCEEDLAYDPNAEYNDCTPHKIVFNTSLSYDQKMGNYKGNLL